MPCVPKLLRVLTAAVLMQKVRCHTGAETMITLDGSRMQTTPKTDTGAKRLLIEFSVDVVTTAQPHQVRQSLSPQMTADVDMLSGPTPTEDPREADNRLDSLARMENATINASQATTSGKPRVQDAVVFAKGAASANQSAATNAMEIASAATSNPKSSGEQSEANATQATDAGGLMPYAETPKEDKSFIARFCAWADESWLIKKAIPTCIIGRAIFGPACVTQATAIFAICRSFY